MPALKPSPPLGRSSRILALLLAIFVGATAVIYLPAPAARAAEQCSLEEWGIRPLECARRLPDLVDARKQCLNPPMPSAPNEGLGGWFASEPRKQKAGLTGMYSETGYAGFEFVLYDAGCTGAVTSPGDEISSQIASLEMMGATFILGAANALRDKAWAPGGLWGWADPLVQRATTSIYEQVFRPFGVLTLALVGLWLLWRARNANASQTITIASWALFVMVLVTAIARWPVASAHLADASLTKTVTVVANAVGPQAAKVDPADCVLGPEACVDHRDAPTRASDTTVNTILYRAWLRGVLGSADSETAKKYGWALHDAASLTWGEAENAEKPQLRKQIIEGKQEQWKKLGEQIREEDPAAYAYLSGDRGSDRVGAGFIALISAAAFAAFDMTSSVLILIGFLIVRWAVIAAPALGTVALLQPAASGLKRLGNTVVGSLISVVVFAIGGPAYLAATDLIMSETSLAGWLQIVLVLLCGIVLWLLLRPYRRLRALAGGDPIRAMRGMQDDLQRQMRRQHRQMRRRQRRNQRRAKTVEQDDDEAGDVLDDDPDAWARPEGQREADDGPVRGFLFLRHESDPDPRAAALGVRPHRGSRPELGAAADLTEATSADASRGDGPPGGDGSAGRRTAADAFTGRTAIDDVLVVDAELVGDQPGNPDQSPTVDGPRPVDVIDAEIVETTPGEPQQVWRPGSGYEVIPARPLPALESADRPEVAAGGDNPPPFVGLREEESL